MARTEKRYLTVPERTQPPAAKYFVGIYSRLSVDHDDKKSESIENQIEIIRQYITGENRRPENRQKFEIFDIYIDRGSSGSSFQRTGFERLMDDVRSQHVNCIIVKDLSRFGRDYLETGNFIEKIFPFLGVRFIAVTDGFDSMSENVSDRKLAMNIRNLVNDMYAKDISKKVMAARKTAAGKGAYIGGAAPYGYTVEETGGLRKLVIHPENAKIVRFLFNSFASGSSYGEIASWLYRKKVHRVSDYHKYGHTYAREGEALYQWEPGTIKGILSNPVYMGRLVRRKGTEPQENGDFLKTENSILKHCRESIMAQGIICRQEPVVEQEVTCSYEAFIKQGASYNHEVIVKQGIFYSHERIIEQETFDRAAAKLRERERRNVCLKEPEKDITGDCGDIFRQMLYCGKCGAKMHRVYYQGRRDGKRKYSYYCRNAYYMDGRRCMKNVIREETLERVCLEQIRNFFKKSNFSFGALCDMNRLEWQQRKAAYLKEQNKMTRKKNRSGLRAGRMYLEYREGRVSGQEYLTFQRSKDAQEQDYEIRIEEIKQKIRKTETGEVEGKRFLHSLLKTDGQMGLNRRFVEAMIERISILPDRTIDIRFRFSKENGGGRNN